VYEGGNRHAMAATFCGFAEHDADMSIKALKWTDKSEKDTYNIESE